MTADDTILENSGLRRRESTLITETWEEQLVEEPPGDQERHPEDTPWDHSQAAVQSSRQWPRHRTDAGREPDGPPATEGSPILLTGCLDRDGHREGCRM